MKKLFILSLLTFLSFKTQESFAQKAINFIQESEKSFEEVKNLASKNKKIIFIDMYATWCSPCKWMDENTFSDKEVIKLYKKRFICYKINMETELGKSLFKIYSIDSYPTYLFINSTGKVLKRMEGKMPVQLFLQESNF